jgi:hypothetical protein
MSDIGILSDWKSIAVICLIFGAPGTAVGAIVGSLLWRSHRIRGTAVGAVAGFAICLSGMLLWVVY